MVKVRILQMFGTGLPTTSTCLTTTGIGCPWPPTSRGILTTSTGAPNYTHRLSIYKHWVIDLQTSSNGPNCKHRGHQLQSLRTKLSTQTPGSQIQALSSKLQALGYKLQALVSKLQTLALGYQLEDRNTCGFEPRATA